jgi:hypothetical protein
MIEIPPDEGVAEVHLAYLDGLAVQERSDDVPVLELEGFE